MKSQAVSEGRELAAQAIEAEARAYEAQFGKTGPGADAAAVLRMAAEIARGQSDERAGEPGTVRAVQGRGRARSNRTAARGPLHGLRRTDGGPPSVRYVLRAWLKHKLLQRL